MSSAEKRLNFWLVAALFTASGFSSLIYQVVWTRQLVLVFGATTFATATVLSVFMGGLALGSFVTGRLSNRINRPFLWYGILEGLIGIWALAIPFLFDAATPLYRLIWQNFHLSMLPFSLLRFSVAAVVLIIPTTCMGATLPLLARFVTESLDYVGRRVGTLYAVNTLGAVGGAATAGFFLLPALGLATTTGLAAAINLILCAVVTALSYQIESKHPQETPSQSATDSGQLTVEVKVVLVAFSASGAIAMIYEVCWTRALSLVIGSSTYAFTIMLTTFLTGIFLGSLLCARQVDRSKEPLVWFVLLQVFVCLASLTAMYSFNLLPWWNLYFNAAFPTNQQATLLARLLLAGGILFPIALLLGAVFPVVIKICARDLSRVGHSVGTAYSANTLGAIAGSFLSGFLLVPWLGVEQTLVVASVSNLLVASLLLSIARTAGLPFKLCVALVSALAVVATVAHPSIWDRTALLCGQGLRRMHRDSGLPWHSYEEWLAFIHNGTDVVFWGDGACSNVGVLYLPDQSSHYTLLTNGCADASDGGDMSEQILLAALPLLWHRNAGDVAIIGWGSGVTVGTASLFPVRNITAIELEPEVLKAATFFDHVNSLRKSDRRVKVELNDGRNYLLATNDSFDVIISEPSNPWQVGVCNLFTRQYFSLCHERLKPGGVLSVWLQTGEIPPAQIKEIVAALNQTFHHCLIFASSPRALVILASDAPPVINPKESKTTLSERRRKHELSRIGIDSLEALLARIQATPDACRKLSASATPNSDDRNELEFAVGMTYENRSYAQDNAAMLDKDPDHPAALLSWSGIRLADQVAILNTTAAEAAKIGRLTRALDWSQSSLALKSNSAALRIQGLVAAARGNHLKAQALWQDALSLQPNDVETLVDKASDLIDTETMTVARAELKRALQLEPDNLNAAYQMARSYTIQSCPGTVTSLTSPALALGYLKGPLADTKFIATNPEVLYLGGLCNHQLGQDDEAERLLRRYLKAKPNSPIAARALASILWFSKDITESSALWFGSLVNGMSDAKPLFIAVPKLHAAGKTAQARTLLRRAFTLWPGDSTAQALAKDLLAESTAASDMQQALQHVPKTSSGVEPLSSTEIRLQLSESAAKSAILAGSFYLLWVILKRSKSRPR
jgi:spermidine synthase